MTSGEPEKVAEVEEPTDEPERPRREPEAFAEIINLQLLPPGAHPLPFAELEFEEVPKIRWLNCDTYDGCLDFAAHVRWRGFHCRKCPKTQPSEANTESEPKAQKLAPVIKFTPRS